MSRYVKLFEDFEDHEINDQEVSQATEVGSKDVKPADGWVKDIPNIQEKIKEWVKLSDAISEAQAKIDEFKMSLGLNNIEADLKRTLEDIEIAMHDIGMSTIRVNGYIAKYRKPTFRNSPPGPEMILDLLILEYKMVAATVEKIKKDPSFTTRSPVKGGVKITKEDTNVSESSSMEDDNRPWYKRMYSNIKTFLEGVRNKIVKSSVNIHKLVDELEEELA